MKKEDCKHEKFASEVRVGRLTESEESDKVTGYTAEVKTWCAQCEQEFEFMGVLAGYSTIHPTTSIDGTELRIPIKPYDGKIKTEAKYST